MRSFELSGNCEIKFIELPDPVPGPGEVVIKTAASAICGSEMGSYRNAGRKGGITQAGKFASEEYE